MKSILSNTRKPDVSFYSDGRIDITARVAKELDLREGDVIDIAVDGNEYLLYKKHSGKDIVGRHEGQLHETKKGLRACYNLRTYSKRLSIAMIQASCSHEMEARLPIGMPTTITQTSIKAVPIIYKNNLV